MTRSREEVDAALEAAWLLVNGERADAAVPLRAALARAVLLRTLAPGETATCWNCEGWGVDIVYGGVGKREEERACHLCDKTGSLDASRSEAVWSAALWGPPLAPFRRGNL